MNLINITPTQEQIIKDVCNFEQESLIRIHSGTSTLTPRFAELLEERGLTMEDYEDYSSEMFYNFQCVLEEPPLIRDQNPLFYLVFLEACEHYKDILEKEYGEHFTDLRDAVRSLIPLKTIILN